MTSPGEPVVPADETAVPPDGTPVLPAADGTMPPLNGLLRLTALTTWRALAWTTGTVLSTGTQALTRALDGDPPVVILRDIVTEIRVTVGTALDGYGATPAARYGAEAGLLARDHRGVVRMATPAGLRARGAALLDLSADVTATVDDAGHPAYARMLSELTPDEARILRLLYQAGPQPAIDIRTGRPLGIGSELVAGGLNMIEIRHVASAAPAPDGALTRAPGPFLLHAVGAAPDDEARAKADAVLDAVLAAARPADTGLSAPTFREGQPDDAGAFRPADLDRLTAISRQLNPDGTLVFVRGLPREITQK